jgi:MFS family permease
MRRCYRLRPAPIDGPSRSGGCGGRSGFIGTVLIGRVIEKGLYRTLCGLPLTLAVVAAALATFGASTWGPVALLAVWGAAFPAAPVAGWTWLAATAPNDAEAGVGLMVAGGQMAITLGATLGGIVFDVAGAVPTFWSSAGVLAVAALATGTLARVQRNGSQTARALQRWRPASGTYRRGSMRNEEFEINCRSTGALLGLRAHSKNQAPRWAASPHKSS